MPTDMNSSLYFIAILPPKKLREEIRVLKEEIKEKYQAKQALKLPAHITLQPPFRLTYMEEKALLDTLQTFATNHTGFKIKLNGFGCFPPRVIFIELTDPGPIKEFHRDLLKTLKGFVPQEENQPIRELHPHITLATRDLHRKVFKKAWQNFKNREFLATFMVKGLCLFKHNRKSWDIYSQFQFGNSEF